MSWSGAGRYLIGLAIMALTIGLFLWEGRMREAPDHYVVLTLVAIASIVLFGAGPGVLTTVGALAGAYLLVTMGVSDAQWRSSSAFLLTLIAVNIVALRTTFWRARAEYHAAHVTRLVEQLKLLTDGAVHYALYMTDVSGRVVHWNKAAERFTGWSARAILHRHVALLYQGNTDMRSNLEQAFALAEEHGSCEFDYEFVRADGTSYLQNCVVTALYDNDGKLQGFASLIRDVTLERAHEVALQERENELRSILETAPDGVFVFNATGHIDYINKAASAMFGYNLVELKGKAFSSLLSVSFPGAAIASEQLVNVIDVAQTLQKTLVGRRRNGSNFPIEITFVRVETNGETHFTAFVRDLSEQEATKARLETLQAEMLHGTRYSAMGAMASMLAHELNQPLTALAAYMEGGAILLDRAQTSNNARLEKTFKLAAAEAVRAGAIMRHLRDFVSNGEAQLEIHEAGEVIRSSISLISGAAEKAHVQIMLDIDHEAGPIFCDAVQVQQVIGNLCRNAIDAMRGSPERLLTVRAFPVDELMTQFMIVDTGSGIPTEIRERLFDAFVSSKEEGTGVGLSICRTIVESHGGKIWVEPTPTGSCFCFSLKRKKGTPGGTVENDSHSGRRGFRSGSDGLLTGT